MQHDLEPFKFVGQVRIEDRVPGRSRDRVLDHQAVDLVAEIVQHAHGVTEKRLRIEVGIGLGFQHAVRCDQIAHIEGERRPAVSGGMALPRNLLVFESRVFHELKQIEVDPASVDTRHGDIRRRDGHRWVHHHPVEQQRAQGSRNSRDRHMSCHTGYRLLTPRRACA